MDVLTVPADPFGANADAAVAAGATGSIQAKLRRATQGLEDLKSLIVLAAGEAHVGAVGGHTNLVLVEKTRPADAAAYIVYDTINESASAGTLWTFSVARANDKTAIVLCAVVLSDDVTNLPQLELILYKTDITAVNDNAEATSLYANVANYLGTVTFPAMVKPTTNSTLAVAYKDDFRILAIPKTGTQNIYGVLRTLTAFTPASGKKYTVGLGVSQD